MKFLLLMVALHLLILHQFRKDQSAMENPENTGSSGNRIFPETLRDSLNVRNVDSTALTLKPDAFTLIPSEGFTIIRVLPQTSNTSYTHWLVY